MTAVCPGGEENQHVNAKVVVTIVVIAFAAFMVITQPQDSADAVHAAFDGVTTFFRSFATFVSSL
jgi:hypothetical protein